jgi:hypothetical protein
VIYAENVPNGGYACGLPGDSTTYMIDIRLMERRREFHDALSRGSGVPVLIAGPTYQTHGDPTYLIAAEAGAPAHVLDA